MENNRLSYEAIPVCNLLPNTILKSNLRSEMSLLSCSQNRYQGLLIDEFRLNFFLEKLVDRFQSSLRLRVIFAISNGYGAVFGPFFSAWPDGSGLGISYPIIYQHGGLSIGE